MKCKACEGPHGWYLDWHDGRRSWMPDKESAKKCEAAPDMYEALKRAREYVVDSRNTLADCHRNFSTGLLEPEDVCSIEDALLFEIDVALAKATP